MTVFWTLRKEANPTIQIVGTTEMARSDGPPVALVSYVGKGKNGKLVYSIRGFLAMGDICGDLEIYGDDVSVIQDPDLKKVWESYRLDPDYSPKFSDVFLYAQILYQNHMYQAAAPVFEQALTKLKDDKDKDQLMWQRVTTDQAGMAYGLAGNLPKARAIFEAAIIKDPEYHHVTTTILLALTLVAKKLAACQDVISALRHSPRKASVVRGEAMPDPTKDDSFLPYRDNTRDLLWPFMLRVCVELVSKPLARPARSPPCARRFRVKRPSRKLSGVEFCTHLTYPATGTQSLERLA